MTRSVPEANSAIAAVHSMPYGVARSQAAAQQVLLAETEGPPEVLAYALATQVDSLVWGEEAEKAFVPFTKQVRWWDAHPEHFDEQDRFSLFWSFKWMVANLMEFPTVPADQIEATLQDMERRFAVEGLGMNAVRHQRWMWADERGVPEGETAFEAWVATPRDEFSQCEACEPGDQAAHLFATGRYDEGIRLLERTLADSPSCGTEPADMLSHLALAYLAVDRDADAVSAHRRCLAHLDGATGGMEGPRGRIIELLARAGHDEAALRRIRDEERLLTGCDSPGVRLGFLRHVGTATHLISVDRPDLPVTLTTVPATTVGELDAWVEAAALDLARAFDRRNGTDHHERSVRADRTATRPARVIPLSVLAPAPAEQTADRPAASTEAPGATSEPPAPTVLERAEEAAACGDLEAAAGLYLTASGQAEARGDVAGAGWALAEAAQCAHLLHDEEGAAQAFVRTLRLLAAGGVPATLRGPVARAAASAAAPSGRAGEVLPVVEALLAELGDAADDDLLDETLAARALAARRTETAHLTDTRARLLATLGERAEAAATAERAAEAFAGLGLLADAAHAFWLAGRAHLEGGDPGAAAAHLESAFEGFGLARRRTERAEVGGELITALRAAGRDDEADAVTRG